MKRIICLGSHQGADSAAWLLADALIAQLPKHRAPDRVAATGADMGAVGGFEVLLCASPAQMLGLFAGAEAVAIIDAAPQLPAGTLQRVGMDELRQDGAWSSHGLDLITVLKLAQTLGDMPARCVLLGLGVGSVDADPHSAVSAALPDVLDELTRL